MVIERMIKRIRPVLEQDACARSVLDLPEKWETGGGHVKPSGLLSQSR